MHSKEQLIKGTHGGVEGCVLIFCKNTKIASSCWTTIDMRMCVTTKERYLTPWGKEKPQKNGRRGEITFKIKSHTCQRCLEGTNKTLYSPGPRERSSDLHKRLSQTYLWVFECLLRRHRSAVACHRDWGSESNIPGKHGMWPKLSRKRSPLAPLQNCGADNPQTVKQLYQRSSCTVVKVLGTTTDFPTWGSDKVT